VALLKGKTAVITGGSAGVADAGRRLDVVFANAAAIDVARIGEGCGSARFA
jgi:hypothetical protein